MPTLSGILLDADNEVVHIAVVDAPSHELLDALHFATTRRIDIVCWTRQQMEGHTHTPQKCSLRSHKSSASAADLLNQTFHSALEKRASDIHFEPAENHYRIRLRVDGVLHALPEVTTEMGIAITARLKVLGSLDIAEHRLHKTDNLPLRFQENYLVSHRHPALSLRRKSRVAATSSGRAVTGDRRTGECKTRSWAAFSEALQQPQG
jgi:protein transport protein HofB